jgi:hypothetical protein
VGFIAKNAGTFKQVPPGNYVARCYQLIDLGHQTSEKFGTSAHKIRIGWELYGEDEQGQPLTVQRDGQTLPMTVAAEYTVSLNEKANLRKHLVAWRGRDFTAEELKAFDISKLLGAYCLLNVTNSDSASGKTYANVSGIAPLPKQMANNKPAPGHQIQQLDLDDPDMDVFEELPQFLKDRIEASPEWQTLMSKRRLPAQTQALATTADDDDSDVPF